MSHIPKLILAWVLVWTGCAGAAKVKSGLEVLLEDSLAVVKGRRLGLVTNQTAVDAQGRGIVALLQARHGLHLMRLFSPEHGLDGSRPAGELIRDQVDPASGLPVSSLYQGSRTVDPALLNGLDALLFDIQDIGIRPYTFASTLAEVLKAAKAADVEVILLDRPNPLGGGMVGGLTLDPAFSSFIGPYPIPYVHGLTLGELGQLFNTRFGIGCRLRVLPMKGWKRTMLFPDTGLPWIPTSPNVPTWDTPLAMAITGPVGELGSCSIGIGTASPFWMVGTDSTQAQGLADAFNGEALAGLRAMPWHWRPVSGSWKDRACHGLRLLVTDMGAVDPGASQLALLELLNTAVDSFAWRASEGQQRMFDKAMGTDGPRKSLQAGAPMSALRKRMALDRQAWLETRRAVLLYPEPK